MISHQIIIDQSIFFYDILSQILSYLLYNLNDISITSLILLIFFIIHILDDDLDDIEISVCTTMLLLENTSDGLACKENQKKKE